MASIEQTRSFKTEYQIRSTDEPDTWRTVDEATATAAVLAGREARMRLVGQWHHLGPGDGLGNG